MGLCINEPASKLTEAELDAHIAANRPGPILRRLPSGRDVLDTGRVLIGARSGEQQRQRQISADAERVQTALIAPQQQRIHPADCIVFWACSVGAAALILMALAGWLQ